jgi:hypothetical protein
MKGEYITLVETNFIENETWYYFIKKENNEKEIDFLQKQLDSIEWYIDGDLSVFNLDVKNPVSAETAKFMSKIDVNSYMFHRKFDGKLKKIDFKFGSKNKNNSKIMLKKMKKVFDLLSYGQIDNFINDEDIDTDDLESENSNDDSNDDFNDDSNDNSNDDSDSEDSEDSDKSSEKKLITSLPKLLYISKKEK